MIGPASEQTMAPCAQLGQGRGLTHARAGGSGGAAVGSATAPAAAAAPAAEAGAKK